MIGSEAAFKEIYEEILKENKSVIALLEGRYHMGAKGE